MAAGGEVVANADGVAVHAIERVADHVHVDLNRVLGVDEEAGLASAVAAGTVPDGVVVDVGSRRARTQEAEIDSATAARCAGSLQVVADDSERHVAACA